MKFLALFLALSTALLGQISDFWQENRQILIVGEQHTLQNQSQLVLQNLPTLKVAGMQHLAIELPSHHQKTLQEFAAKNRSLDWLSNKLWETSYEKLPIGFQLKLQMVEWARAQQTPVWAIDADKNLFYQIASLQTVALRGGIRTYVDPTGEEIIQRRGIVPQHENIGAQDANAKAWQLWLNERTKTMAKNLAELASRHPNERIVAIVGNAHADLSAFRRMFALQGVDLSQTANDSIKGYLPENLQAKTQTLSLQGGFEFSGDVTKLHAASLTAVEANLIARGMSKKLVTLKNVDGYPAINSVIFLPLQQVAAD